MYLYLMYCYMIRRVLHLFKLPGSLTFCLLSKNEDEAMQISSLFDFFVFWLGMLEVCKEPVQS